jgi:peptidoglycan/LPS O-acetylase OafA/YrhL
MRSGTDQPIRLHSLTSLRFFAAIFVLLAHSGDAFVPTPWFRDFVAVAFIPVSFFFVLSGFVLTWSYKADASSGMFFKRRAARILPLHAITWACALPVLFFEQNHLGVLPSLAALLLVQSFVPMRSYYYAGNGPSWSLSCEAFFYALFPWLRRWVEPMSVRRALWWTAIVGAAMTVVIVTGAALLSRPTEKGLLHIDPLSRVGEFVIGMLLARAMMSGWRPRISFAWAAAAFMAVYTLAAVLNTVTDHGLPSSTDALQYQFLASGLPRSVGALMALPFTCLLIIAAARADLEGRAGLRNAKLVLLGEASLSMYLTHPFVVKGTLWLIKPVPALRHGLAAWGVEAFVACAATALALISYHHIERRLERKILGRATPRRDVSIPAQPQPQPQMQMQSQTPLQSQPRPVTAP